MAAVDAGRGDGCAGGSPGAADDRRLRRSDEEDPRYTEFLEGDPTAAVVAKVFVTQGLCQLRVSALIQLAAASPLPRTARRWLFPAGIAVMLTGAVIEALADHQKTQFQQRGDDKPDVLDPACGAGPGTQLLRGLGGPGTEHGLQWPHHHPARGPSRRRPP
jgi:hypothetical protein